MMHLEEYIWKMAGGFIGVPIMTPRHWCNVLHVSFWAALVFTLNADSTSGCTPRINVRRHTLYEISHGQDLTINCTVIFCHGSAPTVSWYKLEGTAQPTPVSTDSHIKTEWKQVNSSEGISFLTFQSILSSDSHLYQCRVENDVGHSINVSVHGGSGITPNRVKNNTNLTDLEPQTDIWVYVYSAAGTAGFVTVVIVLTLLVRWCKGKPKKETQSENQHTAIPMVEASFPRGSGVQPSPRASPSAPPPHLSAERSRDQVYGKKEEDRKGKRNRAEEGSGIVYAALNHQLPSGAAPRPRKAQECSEYAAIRVL